VEGQLLEHIVMQSQLVSPSQMWSKPDVVKGMALVILKFAEPIYASQTLQLRIGLWALFPSLTDQNAQILCTRLPYNTQSIMLDV